MFPRRRPRRFASGMSGAIAKPLSPLALVGEIAAVLNAAANADVAAA